MAEKVTVEIIVGFDPNPFPAVVSTQGPPRDNPGLCERTTLLKRRIEAVALCRNISYQLHTYTWIAFALVKFDSPFVQLRPKQARRRPNEARTSPGAALERMEED